MQIEKADIVLSVAGHDKGKLFFVLDVKDGKCFLANGKTGRMAEKPKIKSLKHLQFIARPDCETARRLHSGQPAQNCELRRDLAKFRHEQGGF